MEKYLNKITCADNMDVLKELPDDSIDLMMTDPPYGWNFMGRDWDKAIPSVDTWKECLRVLKPGAFAFIMSGPRQDCLARMIINLEDAGFMVNFTSIYHVFGTGFPKAGNVSKLLDRRSGIKREVVGLKKHSTGFEKALNNKVGFLQDPANRNNTKCFGYGDEEITIPATPEAKYFDGSYTGFQPKPCLEVIITVMVPLSEKTYIDQALANGKGITWLSDGGIPSKEPIRINRHKGYNSNSLVESTKGKWQGDYTIEQSRFAPNLLVSNDALNDGTVRSSGSDCIRRKEGMFVEHGGLGKAGDVQITYGDSGSFSRYFSLDLWAEKYLPESVNKTFPCLCVPKASKSEKNLGLHGLPKKQMYKCDGSGQSLEIFGSTDGGRQPRQNTHPTCKPIRLISYCLMIGSRDGDIVLDPYLGSGTTAIAAIRLGRKFIGVDNDPDSCEIAQARVDYELMQPLMEF